MAEKTLSGTTNAVVVFTRLPEELVLWMDTYLAEKRLEALKNGKLDATIPTRSSLIRGLLFKLKNNGNK